MITKQMTARQITDHINSDRPMLQRLLHGRMNSKIKNFSKSNYDLMSIRWTSALSHQPYFVSICKLRKKYTSKMYAIVQEEHSVQYYTHVDGSEQNVRIVSSHFLSRYRERTHTTLTGDDFILMALSGGFVHIKIYDNPEEGKVVFMRPEGLELGSYHDDIVTLCTFVPFDMLKDTQRQAYLNAEDTMRYIAQTIYDAKTPKQIMDSHSITDYDMTMLSISHDIYNQYFEK